MAFRTGEDLSAAYVRLKLVAKSLKSISASYRGQLAAGPVAVPNVTGPMLDSFRNASLQFNNIPAGLVNFAKDQENDQNYDVAAEFVAMRNACDAVIDWIVTNAPKDGSNRLLERTIAAGGVITDVTRSSAQTAGLRTVMQAFEDLVA